MFSLTFRSADTRLWLKVKIQKNTVLEFIHIR